MAIQKDERLTVRVPSKIKEDMRKYCEEHDITMSQLVRKLWHGDNRGVNNISSLERVKEINELNEAQKRAKLKGDSKGRVKILEIMSEKVRGYTERAKAGTLK